MIRTNKILFVGDPHLDSSTPSSRIDDYADSSIDKLYALKNLCIVKDIKFVVILGDVFNKHDQANTYINRVLKVFKEFQQENIQVYTIIGNHDLSFERLDTLDRSPLQILLLSGIVKHLTKEVVDTGIYTVGVYGNDYPDLQITPVSELKTSDTLNVLATHRFYNYAFNDVHNLSAEDCAILGYNVYAMGHDHCQYDVEKMQNFWVVRPGSLMRTTSNAYHLTRNISVDIVEFSGTKEAPQLIYSRENIPCKPSSEVFSSSVYQRGEEKSMEERMEDLHMRVSEMLVKMDSRASSKDVFNVLDEICTDPEVKQCIEIYLNGGGYARQ